MTVYLQTCARASGMGCEIPVEVVSVEAPERARKRGGAPEYYNIRRMALVRFPWGVEDTYQVRDLVDENGGLADLSGYPVTDNPRAQ